MRRDEVVISGSAGEIRCAVFDDVALMLDSDDGRETIEIANPVPIQSCHVGAMARRLAGTASHPSTGVSAARTAWVMEQMLR